MRIELKQKKKSVNYNIIAKKAVFLSPRSGIPKAVYTGIPIIIGKFTKYKSFL